MTRVCLDSNVLVAAFASRGLCADLLAHVLSEEHLVVPDLVRSEVLWVLSEKLALSDEVLRSVTAVLDRCEAAPETGADSPIGLRDSGDERILADAIEAGVQLMVSGDKDLLSVAEDASIPILSPRAFMMLIRGGTL